jgi:hypothetical protein
VEARVGIVQLLQEIIGDVEIGVSHLS